MNKDSLLISIIVPVYNTELFLTKCLDSITGQTYLNLEIILVDDGSKDKSGQICDEYAEKDHRIKVLHKQNEGVVQARIDAYSIATGDYITFVDSDDYISKDAIKLLVDYSVKYQADLVVAQYIDVYEDKFIPNNRTIKGCFTKNSIKDLFSNNLLYDPKCFGSGLPLHLCEKLIKRELLKNVLNKAERQWYGEDIISILHLMKKVNKMVVVDDHIYYYVHHPDEAINRSPLEKWPAFELVWKRIIEFDEQCLFSNQLPYRIWSFTKIIFYSVLSFKKYKKFKEGINTISKSFYVKKYIFNNPDFHLMTTSDKKIYFILKYNLFSLLYLYKKIMRI